jgi:hypothetical protein
MIFFLDSEGSFEGNLSLANSPKANYCNPFTVTFVSFRVKLLKELRQKGFTSNKVSVPSKWDNPVIFL